MLRKIESDRATMRDAGIPIPFTYRSGKHAKRGFPGVRAMVFPAAKGINEFIEMNASSLGLQLRDFEKVKGR